MARLPRLGTPNYFVQFDDDAWGYASQDQLQIWGFSVDWSDPASSTFTQVAAPATAPFDLQICPTFRGQCIDQPDGAPKLEDLADRLMYRLQYRNFGDHQTLAVNHTVDATGTGRAGVRWYELRNSGAGWDIFQQGTYAPNDGLHRWMGSLAMDRVGNIAVGYSVSSTSTYPSIRYTGRLAGDPLGSMPQIEAQIVAGSDSQDGASRWGDYSMMVLDPTDDCTFWYTQEYVSGPNPIQWANWFTRVASFRFPTCTTGPSGNLQGTVTDADTTAPIANALVNLGSGIMTFTDASGFYQVLGVPEETYTVAAQAYGYSIQSVSGVVISNGVTTTQDFTLTQLPVVTVSGSVTDEGHNWPLYARLDVSSYGFSGSFFTDPLTGQYSLELFENTDYTFVVSAMTPGYINDTRMVTPPSGGAVEDFVLAADLDMCLAQGYEPQLVYFEDFETTDGEYVPGGFTTWAWGTPTSGPGKAHSGENAWATNLSGNYNDNEDGIITSPTIDLSAYSGQTVIVSWWQWLQTEDCCDFASLEVSKDSGSSWFSVYGPISGSADLDWAKHTAVLDPSFAVAEFQLRFHLFSDSSITFPGYYIDDVGIGVAPAPPTYYSQDFESNNGGFAGGGVNSSWAWGTPTRGPAGAHSGVNALATNLDGNYNNNEDSLSHFSTDRLECSNRSGLAPLVVGVAADRKRL